MKNRRAFSLIEISIVIITIGVLIAGIAASGSIISKARLKAARSITSGSPVSSTDDLIVWLETTSADSFGKSEAINDSAVGNWYGINLQNAVKIDASSSGSGRPTYKSECINGLPCLDFTAANSNYMTTTQEISPINEMTVFIVANFKTLESVAPRTIICSDSNGLVDSNVIVNSTTDFRVNFNIFGAQNGLANGQIHASADDSITTTPYIISFVDNNTLGTVYLNGAASGTPAGTGISKNLGIIGIGSRYDGSTRVSHSDMHLGELIIFSRALTKEERRDITTYLSKKWSIKVTQ